MQLSIAQRSKPSAAPPELNAALRVESRGYGVHAVCFQAMASPCEVLRGGGPRDAAPCASLGDRRLEEAWRIERKFSRYRSDNIVAAINCTPTARADRRRRRDRHAARLRGPLPSS